MKKIILLLLMLIICDTIFAAFQYNVVSYYDKYGPFTVKSEVEGGYFTFDSTTSITMNTTGRDFKFTNKQGNLINTLPNLNDYGWYNINTGEVGSFANGVVGTFNAGDKIGIWMDYDGDAIYTTTENSGITGAKFGYAYDEGKYGYCLHRGSYWVTQKGQNANSREAFEDKSHYEYTLIIDENSNVPTGQPLPGAVASLLVGGVTLLSAKKLKK